MNECQSWLETDKQGQRSKIFSYCLTWSRTFKALCHSSILKIKLLLQSWRKQPSFSGFPAREVRKTASDLPKALLSKIKASPPQKEPADGSDSDEMEWIEARLKNKQVRTRLYLFSNKEVDMTHFQVFEVTKWLSTLNSLLMFSV